MTWALVAKRKGYPHNSSLIILKRPCLKRKLIRSMAVIWPHIPSGYRQRDLGDIYPFNAMRL